jgi:hypothetical protein
MSEDSIDQYAQQILLDGKSAQILFEVSPLHSFEKAEKIIEQLGNQIVEINYLNSNIVLLKLNQKDMREVVLKLIENGFEKIKGINAAVK